MNGNRLFDSFFSAEDKPSKKHRCIYYSVTRKHPSKENTTRCAGCNGYNTDCENYESKYAFDNWVAERQRSGDS